MQFLYPYTPKNKYDFSLYLKGEGINPVLLSGEPEFRPNFFKATLRGHALRLLAGYSNPHNKVGILFGSTKAPAQVEIFDKFALATLSTSFPTSPI